MTSRHVRIAGICVCVLSSALQCVLAQSVGDRGHHRTPSSVVEQYRDAEVNEQLEGFPK